jgi:CHAT domain-containing protein
VPRSRQLAEQGMAFAQGNIAVPGVALQMAGMSNQLARILRQQHDLPGALQRAQGAVSIAEDALASLPPQGRERVRDNARRQAASGLLNQAHTLRDLKRPQDAEAALARAVGYVRMLGLAEFEAEVAATRAQLAQERGDHAAAAAAYEEAIVRLKKEAGQPFLIALHAGAARSLGQVGRVDEALEHSRQAMALVEDVRAELQASDLRSGFVEDKQGLYATGAHLAVRAGKPAEAFEFAERGRARAFLDLLGNQATLSKGSTRTLVAEEVRLRADLAEAKALADDPDQEPGAARPRIEAAEREYRAFLEQVRKDNVEQASLMAVEPVSAAEVQALLPARTTLLEYLVGAEDTLVWTIDRDKVRAHRLHVGRAALVAEVRGLRSAITDQQPLADVQARARALYDRLLAPVRERITTERVIVVPHDVLHYLPFAALRTPGDRWLVEDVALSTLPSASVLKYLGGKERGTAQGVVAIGNPDLGTGLQLGWAEREARFIGGRYPSATVLVRDDATKKRALAAGAAAGVLHFATHGDLNEQNPLDSALLLTPADGNDGRLAVRDIFTLDLHAKLVVLSACETGLGKLSRGDELVGLQRAFLYAGTPAVVTTLWKVDDRASYELVRAFYERLAAAPAAEALRQAQLATLKTFPHPFQWAAFTLSGLSP